MFCLILSSVFSHRSLVVLRIQSPRSGQKRAPEHTAAHEQILNFLKSHFSVEIVVTQWLQ